uniref:TF-B3 domain-containing protein n=1 Tax=Oryza meridionalis TaxID=40149 RepID=A0A0E0DHJ6_9ORYZ
MEKKTLLSPHGTPTSVTLEQRVGSFFIFEGWKTFTQQIGLCFGHYIRFNVTSPSTLDVLVFDKDGHNKLPLTALSKHKSNQAQVHQTTDAQQKNHQHLGLSSSRHFNRDDSEHVTRRSLQLGERMGRCRNK